MKKYLTQPELAYYLHQIGFSLYGADALAEYLITMDKEAVFDETNLRLEYTEYEYIEDAAEDNEWDGEGDALAYMKSKTLVLSVPTGAFIIKEF